MAKRPKKPKKEKPTHGKKVSESARLKAKGYNASQADALAGVDDDELTHDEIEVARIALQRNFPKG